MVFSTFVPKQSFATALLFLLVACVASQEEHHQQQQTSHIRMSNADAEAVAAATHPEELSLSSSSLSVESHQHHRRAIFSLASRACLAGLPAPCLCTEEGVLAAIASSGGGSANATNKVFLGRPKVIQICSGTCA